MTDSEIGAALQLFARNLLSARDPDELLSELTHWVVELLGAAGAGVMLADQPHRLRLVTATSQPVRRAERSQELEADGPSPEVVATGERVVAPDLATTDRWPAYVHTALTEDLRAVVGTPMVAGERVIGALTVYERAPRTFTDAELRTIEVLTEVAAACATTVGDLQRARRLAADLQQALDRRVPIEQAKGLIAGRLGVSLQEAFDLLRASARRQQRSVHDVARQLVAEGLPERWPD